MQSKPVIIMSVTTHFFLYNTLTKLVKMSIIGYQIFRIIAKHRYNSGIEFSLTDFDFNPISVIIYRRNKMWLRARLFCYFRYLILQSKVLYWNIKKFRLNKENRNTCVMHWRGGLEQETGSVRNGCMWSIILYNNVFVKRCVHC